MAVSPRLPKHLRDALGPDAGEELVSIIDEMRSQHADHRAEIRADFAEFRRELQTMMLAQFQAFEARQSERFDRIDARFDAVDARFDTVDARFDTVDARFERSDLRFEGINARFNALEIKVGDVKSDLLKWSFVFWCGSVTAIALLARVLER